MGSCKTRVFFLLLFSLAFSVSLDAQEYNTVPLGDPAYDLIEMGILRGAVIPPPSAKPWPLQTVKEKLQEMLDNNNQLLSVKETEAVSLALVSFQRQDGWDTNKGRYRKENEKSSDDKASDDKSSFEIGFGWESFFGVQAPGGSVTSINKASIYTGGDAGNFFSWNINVLPEFLYIGRQEIGAPYKTAYSIPAAFPYSFSKQWDGRVLSLANPGTFTPWPDDPSLGLGIEAQFNFSFLERRIQLRLGRMRRDWGHGETGASLFLNSNARPFAALEGIFSPLYWLDISFITGALEYFPQNGSNTENRFFNNMLSALRLEFNPVKYIYFDLGTSIIPFETFRIAYFANLELRLPNIFKLWGSVFIDNLDLSMDSPFSMNVNSNAYQAGIKAAIRWFPMGAFSLRYTKVEPYCYSYFVNAGESLGYYMPPNSDELLLSLESQIIPGMKAYLQYQMIRHGADFGDKAVGGSSLNDKLTNTASKKYFLMDGVYQWDNVLKLGLSFRPPVKALLLSFFTELGYVNTRFSRNGTAGVGNEADYEFFSDNIYKTGNNFIFTFGLKVW